jgi:hypothetical protein
MTISGTGAPHQNFKLWSTTSLVAPITWNDETMADTSGSGTFSFTFLVNTADPAKFYKVESY